MEDSLVSAGRLGTALLSCISKQELRRAGREQPVGVDVAGVVGVDMEQRR